MAIWFRRSKISPSWGGRTTFSGNVLAIRATNQSGSNYRPVSDSSFFSWLRGPHAIFLYGTVAGILLVMALYRWDEMRVDWAGTLTVDAKNFPPQTPETKPSVDVEALKAAHEILNAEHFAFIDYFKESPGNFVALLERHRTGQSRSNAEDQAGRTGSPRPLVLEIFPPQAFTAPTAGPNSGPRDPQKRPIISVTFSEATLTKIADQQSGSP